MFINSRRFRLTRLRSITHLGVAASCGGLVMLRFGSHAHPWQNGLYDALSIIVVFPGIIFLGASGAVRSAPAQRLCRFLNRATAPKLL